MYPFSSFLCNLLSGKFSLKGKTIVITGCDSGFGLGATEALIGMGAHVICLCYTDAGVKQCIGYGAISSFKADLTVEDELKEFANQVKSVCSESGLFAVVHNAGVVTAGFIDFQPIQNYRKCMELNFFAVVSLTSELLPLLKEPDITGLSKRIVIMSSVDGLVACATNAPYCASKFAVEAYAECLRTEQSLWNIEVSVINPSTFKTPLAMGYASSGRRTYDEMLALDTNKDSRWKKEYTLAWADEFYGGLEKNIANIAEDPIIVVKAIINALSSASPRHRYLVGIAARTIFWILWVFPSIWTSKIKKAVLINPAPSVAMTFRFQ